MAATPAHDYWPACGHRLLARDGQGRLVVTDDFLRDLLDRPELAPVPESCPAELALREQLLARPRSAVGDAQLQAIRDADARDNYAIWLRFRQRLLAQPTLEASYLEIFRADVDVPPLFVAQLTQILLRNALGDHATPMQARAAEMFFRTQKIALQEDGRVMAADDETVERHAVAGNFGSIGELLRQGGIPLRSADLDVLNADNAGDYWGRSDAHDLVACLNHGEPVLQALCDVMAAWLRHMLGLEVQVGIEREIDEEQWVWHVGLDAQANAVLNDLYQGKDVDEARMKRMLCLFALRFAEPSTVRPEVAGKPVYLAMAMDENQRLRLKPQNLLVNLPLARPA